MVAAPSVVALCAASTGEKSMPLARRPFTSHVKKYPASNPPVTTPATEAPSRDESPPKRDESRDESRRAGLAKSSSRRVGSVAAAFVAVSFVGSVAAAIVAVSFAVSFAAVSAAAVSVYCAFAAFLAAAAARSAAAAAGGAVPSRAARSAAPAPPTSSKPRSSAPGPRVSSVSAVSAASPRASRVVASLASGRQCLDRRNNSNALAATRGATGRSRGDDANADGFSVAVVSLATAARPSNAGLVPGARASAPSPRDTRVRGCVAARCERGGEDAIARGGEDAIAFVASTSALTSRTAGSTRNASCIRRRRPSWSSRRVFLRRLARHVGGVRLRRAVFRLGAIRRLLGVSLRFSPPPQRGLPRQRRRALVSAAASRRRRRRRRRTRGGSRRFVVAAVILVRGIVRGKLALRYSDGSSTIRTPAAAMSRARAGANHGRRAPSPTTAWRRDLARDLGRDLFRDLFRDLAATATGSDVLVRTIDGADLRGSGGFGSGVDVGSGLQRRRRRRGRPRLESRRAARRRPISTSRGPFSSSTWTRGPAAPPSASSTDVAPRDRERRAAEIEIGGRLGRGRRTASRRRMRALRIPERRGRRLFAGRTSRTRSRESRGRAVGVRRLLGGSAASAEASLPRPPSTPPSTPPRPRLSPPPSSRAPWRARAARGRRFWIEFSNPARAWSSNLSVRPPPGTARRTRRASSRLVSRTRASGSSPLRPRRGFEPAGSPPSPSLPNPRWSSPPVRRVYTPPRTARRPRPGPPYDYTA